MSELTVYSYGMGEFVFNVFNAVSATIYGKGGGFTDGFGNAIKIAFLLSFTISVYKYILTKSIPDLTKNIFLYIGITTILLMPSPRALVVKDEIIGRPDMTISNVPMGLALPASLVSTGFFELTRLVETSFHHIGDLNYSKSGFLFGSHVIKNASQVKVTDPELNQSLKSYINNCVFYDIYLGAYSFKKLLESDNILQLITENASKNRAFELNGNVTVCSTGAKVLADKLNPGTDNSIIDSSILKYARYLLPSYKGTEEDIKNKVISSVENGYKYLANNSKSAAEILRQNILINAVNDAAIDSPESGMYSYAVTRANAQKAIGNVSTGIMMARWLPAMQGAMEAMMYSCFILVCLFALFTNGEKVISNYIITLTWLSSWPVVYAVMNFGFTWVIAMRSSGLGLSFYDNAALSQIQTDMSSLFGYFSLSVPYFAWGLINLGKQGLGSVFTQMSQLVGSSTQSLSMAASGEAVTGNYSLGNTSFDNHSMHNTSGFKHDTNASFMDGNTATQLGSGSTVTTTADGSSVINMSGSLSNLNTSINFGQMKTAAFSSQGEMAFSSGKNEQHSYSENTSSSLRNLYEVGTNVRQDTSLGDSFRVSTSGGYAEAASDYAHAVNRFAQDNSLSIQDASKILAGAYGNLTSHVDWNSDKQIIGKGVALLSGSSGGLRASLGGKVEKDWARTNQETENISKAEEYLKNNNLTQTFDKAYKGIEDKAYNSNIAEGKSLIENMNASYDASVLASKNYTAYMSQAESFKEMASTSEQDSASYNINAMQDFAEYVAAQPLKTGEGAMGAVKAERLLRDNPGVRQRYIEDFINHEVNKTMSNLDNAKLSSSKVKDAYNTYASSIKDRSSDVLGTFEKNKTNISKSDVGHKLSNTNVDDSVINDTKKILNIADEGIDISKKQIEIPGKQLKDKIEDKVND